MELHRKQDLSIYYWLEGILPSFVNIVDGFPQDADLELPCVSIEALDTRGIPYELGGRDKDKRFWQIDIFAQQKSQRDDFAYKLYTDLENNITVYNYDEGFPPTVSPSQIGVLKCYDRHNKIIHVFEELVRKLYWRRSVIFWTEYESTEDN
jgi:hypothetical protein